MTSTLRPRATRCDPPGRPSSAGALPTPVSASALIPCPSCHLRGPRPSSNRGGFAPPGDARPAPLGWAFVPATRPEGGPEQLDVARRRRQARTPGGPAVIFDIDGVLSDAAGRQHFLEQGRRDWASFFEACGDDPVIEEIARLLELLDPSLAVILLTGRPHRSSPRPWPG